MDDLYCPLLAETAGSPANIPDICHTNCGPLWERAQLEGSGADDIYSDRTSDDCDHHSQLVFSGESLVRATPDPEGNDRRYVIVYECGECGAEEMETVWPFSCALGDSALKATVTHDPNQLVLF